MIDIEKANKAFDEFVSGYDINDEKIKLKYDHTYRVCKQALNICKSINLDEENTNLAYLIAILHDIGRFEQEKLYGTFNDSISVDHAELGCKILFEDGLIRKFIDDDKYDDLISEAVYYHNKYYICPWEEDEMTILHSKIIRDADKIDIIHNVADLGEIRLNEDDNEIGPEVKKDFEDEIPVHYSHKTSKNDAVLTMVAFVFDLNFEYSYENFRKNNYLNKIYIKLKNKDLFKPYIDKANGFVEGKCKNGRIR